jgi:ribosomal protein S18 acetylase RimI-like enzyme
MIFVMNEDRHISLQSPKDEQYKQFFELMLEESRSYLPQTLKAMGMTQARFEKAFRTVGEVHAIAVDQEVAGFCWTEVRESGLHIHALVLRPDWQGKGLGTEIMRGLEAGISPSVKTIEAGVHESNAPALRMCEKLGFKQTSRLSDLGFVILQKPAG